MLPTIRDRGLGLLDRRGNARATPRIWPIVQGGNPNPLAGRFERIFASNPTDSKRSVHYEKIWPSSRGFGIWSQREIHDCAMLAGTERRRRLAPSQPKFEANCGLPMDLARRICARPRMAAVPVKRHFGGNGRCLPLLPAPTPRVTSPCCPTTSYAPRGGGFLMPNQNGLGPAWRPKSFVRRLPVRLFDAVSGRPGRRPA